MLEELEPEVNIHYYSPSTQGFYQSILHKDIPVDAIEIDEDAHKIYGGKTLISNPKGFEEAPPVVITEEDLIANAEARTRAHAKKLGYSEEIQMLLFAGMSLETVPETILETSNALDEVWSHYHLFKATPTEGALTFSTQGCPYGFLELKSVLN